MIARAVVFSVFAVSLLFAGGAATAQETHNATIVIQNHRFEPSELKVPANKKIVLKVINKDATSEEFESKALRVEKVIPGKTEGNVLIKPQKPGRYNFVGEFHEATAKGVLIAE